MFTPDDSMDAMFTLESEKGGVVEDETFHILILGDWSGSQEKRPISERRPIEIDRDNFDVVMERLRPMLTTAGGVPLEFKALDDFHPDAMFKGLPMFSSLRELRQRLGNESTFADAAREVRAWPAAEIHAAGSTVDEAPAVGNLLDAILAKPQGGAPVPKAGVSRELDSLIGEAVRSHLVSIDEGERSTIISAVDRAAGDLITTILSDAHFCEMEAAWRALFLLVRRIETSAHLKIFILDVSKSEIAGDLSAVAAISEAAVFPLLTRPASRESWALICGNYAFEPTVSDIAALMRISQIAAAVNAPFISHMRPTVFGVESLGGDPSEWKVSITAAAGKLWTALRDIPEAEYLGFAAPRFLVRAPYGADSEPLETFSFDEFSERSSGQHYVWANSCFLAALLYAEGFMTNGSVAAAAAVPTDVEGLPTHVSISDGEKVFQGAAEAQLSEKGANFLVQNGMIPVVSFKNTDRLRLPRFQSAAASGTPLRGRWLS